jgi:hypothetical protein
VDWQVTPRKKIWIILKTLPLMRWYQLKNQMRKYPHTSGIKKAKGKTRMQIRIQISINITETKGQFLLRF